MISLYTMDALKRYQLMRALAQESKEDYSWEEAYEIIAEEFSLKISYIEQFHSKYLDVIEEITNDLYPEMWVTSKEERMKDYQRDIDRYNEWLEIGWEKNFALEKRYIKRYVAEELGQLPSRMGAGASEEDSVIGYTVEGVDLGELM